MFSIQYPNNWDKKENQSGGVSFFAPETSTVFAIYIQNVRQLEEMYSREISSLEQFADRNVQAIQQLGSSRYIPTGLNYSMLADQEAIRAESVPDTGTSSDNMLHVWSLAGDNAFTLTFSAREPIYQKYLPTIERMVESFRVLNVHAAATQETQAEANQARTTAKDSQTLPLSEFVPGDKSLTPQNTTTRTNPLSSFVPKSNVVQSIDRFDMTIQLTPYTRGQALRDLGWYEVLGWHLATSNPSSMCPTQNCTFQLEGGQMGQEYTPGERFLSGKLRINSGTTTQIKDLGISWSAVEERIETGQRVQAVEGSLTVGTDRTGPESRYQISGTLMPYGQDLILTIHGVKE